jgi:hypothetical protein
VTPQKEHIPQLPLKFLKWICTPHLLEEIEGDLVQKFEKDVKLYGERKAKIAVEYSPFSPARNFTKK